jgi:hypothetical protein
MRLSRLPLQPNSSVRFFVYFLGLLVLGSLFACGEDGEVDCTISPGDDFYMSYKANSEEYMLTDWAWFILTGDTSNPTQLMTATGADLVSNNNSGWLLLYSGPGTYIIGTDDDDGTATFNFGTSGSFNSDYEDGNQGSVVVSAECNNAIEGTFSFTLKKSDSDSLLSITDGEFRLELN